MKNPKKAKGMTIEFSPEMRTRLEATALKLGMSNSAVVGFAVMLIEGLTDLRLARRASNSEISVDVLNPNENLGGYVTLTYVIPKNML